ncbi:DUF1064 domain-containing protein [Carnimonas bestiolae]|uniref:DUF1064 domain-containing protein n=1 Tax=Carnimonas bestiolae TaxID=3402172 RepID=UPI003EDC0372
MSGNGDLALGRLPAGTMNKTEAAYAVELEARKQAGEIAWYAFEGVKLKLAKLTTYSPDFAVMRSDGLLEMHEVKGFYRDDAKVKVKVAAEKFPFRFLLIRKQAKKRGGGWDIEEVTP